MTPKRVNGIEHNPKPDAELMLTKSDKGRKMKQQQQKKDTSKGSMGVYGARVRKCGRMKEAPLVTTGMVTGASADAETLTIVAAQDGSGLAAPPNRAPAPAASGVAARSDITPLFCNKRTQFLKSMQRRKKKPIRSKSQFSVQRSSLESRHKKNDNNSEFQRTT